MDKLIQKLQDIDNRGAFIILIGIALSSLLLSALSHLINGEIAWWAWADGAFQNFSTEMMGAIATFGLIEIVVARRNKKNDLIAQMGSSDNARANDAVAQLRETGWLQDGSLIEATFNNANLDNTNLEGANLEGAKLIGASLTGANMKKINLKRADLENADLQEASLQEAQLNDAYLKGSNLDNVNLEKTRLPDGSVWTKETDMQKFIGDKSWRPSWKQNRSRIGFSRGARFGSPRPDDKKGDDKGSSSRFGSSSSGSRFGSQKGDDKKGDDKGSSSRFGSSSSGSRFGSQKGDDKKDDRPSNSLFGGRFGSNNDDDKKDDKGSSSRFGGRFGSNNDDDKKDDDKQ